MRVAQAFLPVVEQSLLSVLFLLLLKREEGQECPAAEEDRQECLSHQ
jgi:hypothetical protein